ncbi:unnamed protein product [Caenorhabditis nigoni]
MPAAIFEALSRKFNENFNVDFQSGHQIEGTGCWLGMNYDPTTNSYTRFACCHVGFFVKLATKLKNHFRTHWFKCLGFYFHKIIG